MNEPEDSQARVELDDSGRIIVTVAAECALTAAAARALASELIRAAHKAEADTDEVPPQSLEATRTDPAVASQPGRLVHLTDGLTALPRAVPFIERYGTAAVVQAATAPTDHWLSPLDADRPESQRRRIHITATVGVILTPVPESTILAVMEPSQLYDQRRCQGSKQSGYRRAGSTPGTRMPTTTQELLAWAKAHGFNATFTGSGHHRLNHPDHPGLSVVIASTKSDRRALRNAVHSIRRVFGIDIREQP